MSSIVSRIPVALRRWIPVPIQCRYWKLLKKIVLIARIKWRNSGLALRGFVAFSEIDSVDSGTLHRSTLIVPRKTANYPIPHGSLLDTQSVDVFKRFRASYDPAVYSITLNDCTVFDSPANLAIISRDGHLVDGVAVSMDKHCGLVEAQRTIKMPRTHHLEGHTLMLSTAMSGRCYYHWMIECLPRLKLLESTGQSLSDFDHILIQSNGLPFQQETLDHLQIPLDRVVPYAESPAMFLCEQLTTTTHPVFHLPAEWSLRYVRNRFLPSETTSPPFRKLFISRQGSRRCLANEAELVEALEAAGFVSVRLENLKVADQARMFREALCVVGSHGAGLTNLLFSSPGTRVVELFQPGSVLPFYWAMAHTLGLRYHCLVANGLPATRYLGRSYASEYSVDVAEVLRRCDM